MHTTPPTPIIRYLENPNQPGNGVKVEGDWRTLSLKGRKGLNPTSIHSRLVLPKHNINDTRGTLSMWVASLEDLSYFMPIFPPPDTSPRFLVL